MISECDQIWSDLRGKTGAVASDLNCTCDKLVHAQQYPGQFSTRDVTEKEFKETANLGVVERSA